MGGRIRPGNLGRGNEAERLEAFLCLFLFFVVFPEAFPLFLCVLEVAMFVLFRFFVRVVFCFGFSSLLAPMLVQFWTIFGAQIGEFRHRFGDEFCMSSQERPKSAQDRPRAPQERPRAPQERPKSDPRAAKSSKHMYVVVDLYKLY